jgi:hypothetical protein
MKIVVGLFGSYSNAENAMNALTDAGIALSMISTVANLDAVAVETTDGQSAAALSLLVMAGGMLSSDIGWVLVNGWLLEDGGPRQYNKVRDNFLGVLTEMRIPLDVASRYIDSIREGATLVMVKVENGAAENVDAIMKSHGAINLDTRPSLG